MRFGSFVSGTMLIVEGVYRPRSYDNESGMGQPEVMGGRHASRRKCHGVCECMKKQVIIVRQRHGLFTSVYDPRSHHTQCSVLDGVSDASLVVSLPFSDPS